MRVKRFAHLMGNAKGAVTALTSIALLLTMVGTLVYVRFLDRYDASQYLDHFVLEREYATDEDYTVLSLSVDDAMKAEVEYYGLRIKGTLKTISARQDCITYRLSDVDLGPDRVSKGLSFVLQVPRKSVQGEYVGTWTVKLAYKEDGSNATDTIVLDADGHATFDRSGDVMIEDVSSLRLRGYEELQWREEGGAVTLYAPEAPEDEAA